MFWKQSNKAVYRKSNSIKDTLFQPNKAATNYAKTLLTSMDASERQALGQGLLEEMARSLSIPVPQLTVNDKRQNHSLKDGRLKRKVYGTYKAGNIVISNKTQIRQEIYANQDLTRTSRKCKMKRLKSKFQNHFCILHFAFSLLKMSKFHCLETKPISLLPGVDYSSVGWIEERNPTFLGKLWYCWVSLTPCPTFISDFMERIETDLSFYFE